MAFESMEVINYEEQYYNFLIRPPIANILFKNELNINNKCNKLSITVDLTD